MSRYWFDKQIWAVFGVWWFVGAVVPVAAGSGGVAFAAYLSAATGAVIAVLAALVTAGLRLLSERRYGSPDEPFAGSPPADSDPLVKVDWWTTTAMKRGIVGVWIAWSVLAFSVSNVATVRQGLATVAAAALAAVLIAGLGKFLDQDSRSDDARAAQE